MLELILAVAGWVLAAAGWAMWWGERGRRIDFQWAVGMVLPDPRHRPTGPPVVERTQTSDVEAVKEAEIEQIAEGLLEDARTEGNPVTHQEALEEARRLHEQAFRM